MTLRLSTFGQGVGLGVGGVILLVRVGVVFKRSLVCVSSVWLPRAVCGLGGLFSGSFDSWGRVRYNSSKAN